MLKKLLKNNKKDDKLKKVFEMYVVGIAKDPYLSFLKSGKEELNHENIKEYFNRNHYKK